MSEKEEFEKVIVTNKDLGKLEKKFIEVVKLTSSGVGVHVHVIELDEALEIGAHAKESAIREALTVEFKKASERLQATKKVRTHQPR